MAEKKKKKKKHVVRKILSFILLLTLFAIAVVVVLPIYNKANELKDEINDYLKTIQINQTVTENITIPDDNSDDYDIVWTVNDEHVKVSGNTLLVTRPNFTEGDKVVTLTGNIALDLSTSLEKVIFNFVSFEKVEIKFTILKLDATPLDKIKFVEANIYVPTYTNANIGLLTENDVYPDCTVTWSSSNQAIMNDDGAVVNAGNVTLLATISCANEQKTLEFQVEVGNKLPSISEVDLTFDDLNKTSKYQVYQTSDIIIESVRIFETSVIESEDKINDISQKVARIRVKKDNPVKITFLNKLALSALTFSYLAVDQSSAFTKNTIISLYSSNDNQNWELVQVTDSLKAGNHQFDYQGNDLEKYYYLEITTEYSEVLIDIDNLKLTRTITKEDIVKDLQSQINTTLSASTILPRTTKYGGVVTYNSSNQNVVSNLGCVKKQDNKTIVTLTLTVTGFSFDVNFDIQINVPSKLSQTPVEVFFIDLGKYGVSDCGESIYIKVGNIDVIVDAGDRFSSSFTAIKEVIDANSNDKIIEYVIATHPDSDHIGGMPAVFDAYTIKTLIQFNGNHTTTVYNNYVNAYEEEDCDVCTITDAYNNYNNCTRELNLSEDVVIKFLDTKNYNEKEPNSRSIVFILEAYGIRSLFTGDADNGSNSELEKDYMSQVGNVDILKAVHHGTKEGTTSAFLNAVDPETVIITNGNYLGNKHGHPSPDAINRIYQYDANINIYTTTGGDSEVCEETSSGSYKCDVNDPTVDRNGTIKVIIDEAGYSVYSENFSEPLEISDTNFWKNNPMKEYAHN